MYASKNILSPLRYSIIPLNPFDKFSLKVRFIRSRSVRILYPRDQIINQIFCERQCFTPYS